MFAVLLLVDDASRYMKKKFLVVSLFLLMAGSASANQVYYEMNVAKDTIDMNTTIKLECEDDCPTNWQLSWTLPKDAEVRSVTNEGREVEDYTVENGGIVVKSHSDGRRDAETFKIQMVVDREAEEVYDGLYKREFSLRSFKGAETTGVVHVEDFLSGWTGHGVETSIEGNNLSFRSEGPLNLRVKFGEGFETEYYEFFGDEPENISIAYTVPVGTTGEQLKFRKLPVAILPGWIFNETVSPWSAGEYVGGAAKMREGLKDDFLPVLAHETVHALNDRKLKWDSTSSSYFEEGTSRYVEFLVRKKLYGEERIEKPPREVFGESVRFDPDPNDNYYSTLPPKGSKERLWAYYQEDREYMKVWNPFEASKVTRPFGYAYSELMIRNYVVRQDGSVRELYGNLSIEREISDPQEKWELFSSRIDVTPCKYESRERFNQCLEEINDYNYTVYSAEPDFSGGSQLDIEELEVPDREKPERNGTGDMDLELRPEETDSLRKVLNGLVEVLVRTFSALVESVVSSLAS